MSKIVPEMPAPASHSMHQLSERDPYRLVSQFLDPGLPMRLINSAVDKSIKRTVTQLLELCSLDPDTSVKLFDELMQEPEKLGNGESYIPKTDGYKSLGLITPLAIASYFVKSAVNIRNMNEELILPLHKIPSFLKAVIEVTKPDGRMPSEYEGFDKDSILMSDNYYERVPTLYSIINDINTAHILRSLTISNRDPLIKREMLASVINDYDGSSIARGGWLIELMTKETERHIGLQIKDKYRKGPQIEGFDLHKAKIDPAPGSFKLTDLKRDLWHRAVTNMPRA